MANDGDNVMGFTTWEVSYLLPRIESPVAVEDSRARGWFKHSDLLVAADRKDVLAEIRARGGVPLAVRPSRQGRWASLFSEERASPQYRTQFLQAVSFHAGAGESPGHSLRSVIESETGPLRRRLKLALDAMDQGGTFADALRATGVFDETTCTILEAGERSGSFKDALKTAIEFQNSREYASKIMFGAVGWTAIDLVFAVSAVVGNRFHFLPSVKEQGFKSEDPLEVEMFHQALDLAFLINNIMLFLTGLVILGVLVLVMMAGTAEGRKKIDRWMLKVPTLSDVVVNLAVSSTLRIGGALLQGGVALLPSCEIASRAARFEPVLAFWNTIRQRVEEGDEVRRAVLQPLLSPSERMVVAAHDSQRQLGGIFSMIAGRRDEAATKAAKKFAVVAFVASLAYSSVAVLSSLYVGFIQNKTVMSVPGG